MKTAEVKKPPTKKEFEPKYRIKYIKIDSSFLFQEIEVEILNQSEWWELSYDEEQAARKLIEEKEKIKIYSWASGDVRKARKACGDNIILKEDSLKMIEDPSKQNNSCCCLCGPVEGTGGGYGGGGGYRVYKDKELHRFYRNYF